MRQLYLGIDLGTTNSKAAFLDYREGDTPRPTALEFNQFIEKEVQAFWNYLPSVVYFQNDGKTVIVGEYARRATVNFPGSTVRAVKRLMGKNWRFAPMGWSSDWTPHGISGLILKKIRDRALENLSDKRNDLAHVAISVPASFSSRQRDATVKAAELAGFSGNVVLIDEPSAALIHYIWDRYETQRTFERAHKVLVYDIGGGTLDVSLAEVTSRNGQLHVRILSRSRYTELAGTEFDLRLAAYVVQRLRQQGLDLPQHENARKEIFRTALFDLAEKLKVGMSNTLMNYFMWGFSREGEPFDIDNPLTVGYKIIPRERDIKVNNTYFEVPDLFVSFDHFEQVLRPFFQQPDVGAQENPEGTGTVYGPVINALAEAGLRKEDIDIVLMHGGMSQLPLIQAAMMAYFPPDTVVESSPNPMTSVAQGALLYQASLDGRHSPIVVEEPALFESIFYEHQKGWKTAVDKNRRMDESGIAELPVLPGTKTLQLSLYHGFSERDPLMSHERDLFLEMSSTASEPMTIPLQWSVKRNRTVSFAWQDPSAPGEWRPLEDHKASAHQSADSPDNTLIERRQVENTIIR